MFVDAGSRYEVDHTSGVSHFLQKLAFQVCEREKERVTEPAHFNTLSCHYITEYGEVFQ